VALTTTTTTTMITTSSLLFALSTSNAAPSITAMMMMMTDAFAIVGAHDDRCWNVMLGADNRNGARVGSPNPPVLDDSC